MGLGQALSNHPGYAWAKNDMKTTVLDKMQSIRSKRTEAELDVIDSFRAWLQTVITAGQFGQNQRLPRPPRSQTPNYCRSLAKLPDNALAKELAAPALAVLDQIDYAASIFQGALPPKRASGIRTAEGYLAASPAREIPNPSSQPYNGALRASANPEQEAYAKVLWQLDFALALMLRRLPVLAAARARQTTCPELLREVGNLNSPTNRNYGPGTG